MLFKKVYRKIYYFASKNRTISSRISVHFYSSYTLYITLTHDTVSGNTPSSGIPKYLSYAHGKQDFL